MQSANGCDVIAGRWVDLYTSQVPPTPRCWTSTTWSPTPTPTEAAAQAGTTARRPAFANYLGLEDALIAVSASADRSKSDRSPDQWLPPAHASHCRHAGASVDVKYQWALSVTSAEKAVLEDILSGC